MFDETTMDNIMDLNEDTNSFSGNIKPNVYIHNAIISSQRVLLASTLKGNIKDGVFGYATLIEQIETICKAAGHLKENAYFEQIEKFRKEEELLDIEPLIKITRLANKKLELLMTEVFNKSTDTSAVRFS